MPNWVENSLVITGNKKDLKKLQELMGDNFDFNAISPYPRKFRKMDEKWKKMMKKIEKYREIVRGECSEEEKQRLSRRIEKLSDWLWSHEDGYNSGGYEWCCENWGTKWPASGVEKEEFDSVVHYYFETAWSPPITLISKLSKKFPKLKFELHAEEPGNDYVVDFVWENGEIVEEKIDSYVDYIIKRNIGEDLWNRLSPRQKKKLHFEEKGMVILTEKKILVATEPSECLRKIRDNWRKIKRIEVCDTEDAVFEKIKEIWRESKNKKEFEAKALVFLLET